MPFHLNKVAGILFWMEFKSLIIYKSMDQIFLNNMSRAMRKCVLCHLGTTKAQISLRIRVVWSAPLSFTA